jgi:uncharacterized protein (TIRG00374 family)
LKGHRGKTALGLIITIVLLWWVLRDVSPAEVLRELRDADPWLLAGAVAVATFSFVLRAVRWRVLLLPAYPGSRFDPRFGAVCIGFTVNNLLPARLGEFARAYALSRSEEIGLGASLASVVVERILDGLVLAFFLFVTISLPEFPLGEGTSATIVRRTANVAAVGFAGAFAVLWLMARRPQAAVGLFERMFGRLVGQRLLHSAIPVLSSFIAGLGALRDTAVFFRALVWSVIVWLWLSASIWLGLLAFDITGPGLAGAIFLQTLIAFAVAAPSSPGFFGLFEAATRVGLGIWAVAPSRIVSFATSYHILTFIPVTLIGLWYMRRFGLTLAEVGHREGMAEVSAAGDSAFAPGTGTRTSHPDGPQA